MLTLDNLLKEAKKTYGDILTETESSHISLRYFDQDVEEFIDLTDVESITSKRLQLVLSPSKCLVSFGRIVGL